MRSRTFFLTVCSVLVVSAFGSVLPKIPKIVTGCLTTGGDTVASNIAKIPPFSSKPSVEMAATYKVEALPSPASVIGEGPHWDIASQSLYYIDIYGIDSSVLRYDFAEDKTYSAVIDKEPVVSFIIPVEGTTDQFAVGIGRRVGVIRWDGKSPKATLLRIVFEVEPETKYKFNRFNDAKADPHGRFFGGTMRLEERGDIYEAALGSLYSIGNDQVVTKLKTNIGVSNGLVWNVKAKKFYYIDTTASDVKEFDYDPTTGNITNERVLIDFKSNGKRPVFGPDGMTIDTDGFLYVAAWGTSEVLRIDPRIGKIVQVIKLPAEQITSVAFGGPNLDILFVTTAAQVRQSPQPLPAGKLFKVTGLGVRGLPMSKVRV